MEFQLTRLFIWHTMTLPITSRTLTKVKFTMLLTERMSMTLPTLITEAVTWLKKSSSLSYRETPRLQVGRCWRVTATARCLFSMLITELLGLFRCQLDYLSMQMNLELLSTTWSRRACSQKWSSILKLVRVAPCSLNLRLILTSTLWPLPMRKWALGQLTAVNNPRWMVQWSTHA